MSWTEVFGVALALVAFTSAGCGGVVEGSGAGGSGTGGGRQTTSSNGAGGQTASGGAGGAGGQTASGGAGGGGGCADACVTSGDCPVDLPVCTNLGGGTCNVCLGPCNGAECMGFNTCVSDADCNSSPDARCVCASNGCTICVHGFTGGPPGFPGVLGDGVWLIGWSGGLDHYSWVRFSFLTATTGTFTLMDAEGVSLTPFYPCEGSGPFTVNVSIGMVILDLPAGCDLPTAHLDFQSFSDPGGFPPHAVHAASIFTMGQFISGFQHDAGFCDAGFTMCGDPFLP